MGDPLSGRRERENVELVARAAIIRRDLAAAALAMVLLAVVGVLSYDGVRKRCFYRSETIGHDKKVLFVAEQFAKESTGRYTLQPALGKTSDLVKMGVLVAGDDHYVGYAVGTVGTPTAGTFALVDETGTKPSLVWQRRGRAKGAAHVGVVGVFALLACRVVVDTDHRLAGRPLFGEVVVADLGLRVDQPHDIELLHVDAVDRHQRDLEQPHHLPVLGAAEHAAVGEREGDLLLLLQQPPERERRRDGVGVGVVVGDDEGALAFLDNVEQRVHAVLDGEILVQLRHQRVLGASVD